jgi:hypothetical protein
MPVRIRNRVSTVPAWLPVDPVGDGVLTANWQHFLPRIFYVISPVVPINDQPERQPT